MEEFVKVMLASKGVIDLSNKDIKVKLLIEMEPIDIENEDDISDVYFVIYDGDVKVMFGYIDLINEKVRVYEI